MCDTLCEINSSGSLFAKSSDRPPGEPQVLVPMAARPAGGRMMTQYLEIDDRGSTSGILSQPTWLWGAEHGVNRYGVAIGNEKIWTTTPAPTEPIGLIGMDLVRLGLERGRSATEALDVITDLLERHGQAGIADEIDHEAYFSSFLIVDPTGAWVLETSGERWAAREVMSSASISNRVSLTTEWTRGSEDLVAGFDFDTLRDPLVPTEIADGRLAATQAALGSEVPLAPAGAAAVLRDHGRGPWGPLDGKTRRSDPPPASLGDDFSGMTVCMHIEGYMATTSSMVAELRADGPIRFWAAPGSPCVSPYLPGAIIEGQVIVPAPLSDEATWGSFAGLRDRMMADPGTLEDIRGVMGPIETELFERAADLDDDPNAWAALGDDAGALVAGALDRL